MRSHLVPFDLYHPSNYEEHVFFFLFRFDGGARHKSYVEAEVNKMLSKHDITNGIYNE